MKKFIISVEETLSKDYEIKADTLEEAIEIGTQAYKDGDFIIDGDSCIQSAFLHVSDEDENEEKLIEL